MLKRKIIVTGGAGYIGSHFVRALLNEGHDVKILDNLSTGHIESVPAGASFEKVDILDREGLERSLKASGGSAIVHFAAFASVGESVENPEKYYQNNVVGSFNLIRAARKAGIKNFIFSSTCSVYGNPLKVPISEKESVKPINPYAKTKYMIENILSDYCTAYGLSYVALRYFNAAGADFSGAIGESHIPETHLIPLVLYAAMGKLKGIKVFGDDYETPDGTCIRDYIHINDLAKAHMLALNYLSEGGKSDFFNLGTGDGMSVKNIIEVASKVTGREVGYQIVSRRAGDPAILVADNGKASRVLNWRPEIGLEEIISSAWNWHRNQKY